MSTPTIIIFGPTGHVGSAAALTSLNHGAKVILALRDIHKPVPGLPADQEKAGNVQRVQADLTKPDTIEAAVRSTSAKRAFIYLAHGTTDHMRGTIEALKAGGVEFVVFLSSFAVQGDLRSMQPTDIVAFLHGQVEVNLREVFGAEGYVALRPAFFNTNVMFWERMLHEGEVKVAYPESTFDWISPTDIGRAAGRLLVQGIEATAGEEERNVVTLCGPKLVSQADAVRIFGRVIGKDVKITEVDAEEGVRILIENGLPEFVAGSLVKSLGNGGTLYGDDRHTKGSENLVKYAGSATNLEEWAAANKEMLNV